MAITIGSLKNQKEIISEIIILFIIELVSSITLKNTQSSIYWTATKTQVSDAKFYHF